MSSSQVTRSISREAACGVVAGPLFLATFSVIGAARSGYDWRRHAVSSLACGREGWLQRANFIVTGILYCVAARGLGRDPRSVVGPRLVPALVGAAGAGLISSGIFVTDPVAGFPPPAVGAEEGSGGGASAPLLPTREGRLHNLSAIPVFAGIPLAGLAAAAAAARGRDWRWASYSAGSSAAMVGSFVLFGAAFGGKSNLKERGGLFQRLSVMSGFGWLTALSLRALRALR